MRTVFTILFACFSTIMFSQTELQAKFPQATDFHKVTGDEVNVSFTLNQALTEQQSAMMNQWLGDNASIATASHTGNSYTVAVKAESNNQYIWMKLFHVMGVEMFEIPVGNTTKLVTLEELIAHFDI